MVVAVAIRAIGQWRRPPRKPESGGTATVLCLGVVVGH